MLLLFRGAEIYLLEGPRLPRLGECALRGKPFCVGRWEGKRYLALLLDETAEPAAAPTAGAGASASDTAGEEPRRDVEPQLPAGRWVNRRAAARELESGEFWISARGYQLARWDRESRYCGRCGARNGPTTGEIGKVCEACGHREYPRIAPAMIVAVVRRGRLLMAHAHKHRTGLYSVLAGFVEPGESLEECVHREVAEESGVLLSSVTYFASQSWPFPYSLMVAFTAEAATDEITVEEEEIGDAGWYTPRELLSLPEIPGRLSVSRSLIDWFVDTYGDEDTCRAHHLRD